MDALLEKLTSDVWSYRSTKTYDHSEGLSCCFRQWRAAHSHCSVMHGYALAFKFTFLARELDDQNWRYDFGARKPIRQWLHEMFDHTLLVAKDDPYKAKFEALQEHGLVDVRVMPSVGCEATARFVFEHVNPIVQLESLDRVTLERVEVREHGGNSAIYTKSVKS